MRLPVSVVMITKNEEKHLARALASCDFADEIVVVDACSTDQTREIAKQYGAKIFERKWTNFGDQRNYSLSVAANDWVLVVDADEKVSEQLKNWMEQMFRKKSIESNGFKIRRKEYFLGQEITGACWNPSYQDRFFRKSKAKYVGVIHEYPEAEGGFVRAPEEAYLEHNPNVTVESFFNKMNKYTTIEAFDRFEQGQRTSLPHLFVAFFATWWKNYFYYKGYRDGAYGFVICVMEGVSRTVRHIKLWQLQQLEKKGILNEIEDPRKAGLGNFSSREGESRVEALAGQK